MPALNFMERFADDVESGRKRQTIRPLRKRPIKPGDKLYLYTGQRTKHCRKLGEAVCISVEPMRITAEAPQLRAFGYRTVVGWIDVAPKDGFARADGLSSWDEMREWFANRYGLPFEGVLVRW